MLLHIIKKEKDLEDGKDVGTSTLDENISKFFIFYFFSFFFKNESEIHYFNDENVQDLKRRK